MASREAREAAIRKSARIVRGELRTQLLEERDERVRREERQRIIEWLRSNEAARITAGAGMDPWYVAGRLADAMEKELDRRAEV